MARKLSKLNSVQDYCGRASAPAVDARRLSIFCVSIWHLIMSSFYGLSSSVWNTSCFSVGLRYLKLCTLGLCTLTEIQIVCVSVCVCACVGVCVGACVRMCVCNSVCRVYVLRLYGKSHLCVKYVAGAACTKAIKPCYRVITWRRFDCRQSH